MHSKNNNKQFWIQLTDNFIEYRLIRKLGEGTFSEVLKAQSVQTGQYVAIKCMKSHFDSIDQVRNTSINFQLLIESLTKQSFVKLYIGLKFERN